MPQFQSKAVVLVGLLTAACVGQLTSGSSNTADSSAGRSVISAHQLSSTLLASGPHRSLNIEARLFDRFIGAWDCEFSFRDDNGVVSYASGEVNFGWIIDGWAIQDTWISYTLDGARKARNIGTSVRFFDANAKTWRVVFVAPAFNSLLTLQGGLENERILLRGADTDGALLRWSFNDMKPDSFVWRGERSRDGGTTWRLEEEHRMTRRKYGV